jgi:hypothetical protein
MHLTPDEYGSLELFASLEVRSPTSQALYFVLKALREGAVPAVSRCPHGNDLTVTECDDCAEGTFAAYVAARER